MRETQGESFPPSVDAPREAVDMTNQLWSRIHGVLDAQSIYVTAKLGIADVLADGPLTIGALADRVGASSAALYRILRRLALTGVYREVEPGVFANSPLSEYLRSDVLMSVRDWCILVGEAQYRAYGDLLHVARTGKARFAELHGTPLYEYLAADRELSRHYSRAVRNWMPLRISLVRGYDWSGARQIVDVACGMGQLMGVILQLNREANAVMIDLFPEAIAEADRALTQLGVRSRCELRVADMLRELPRGDAYLISWVLREYGDEQAIGVLRRCREAMVGVGPVIVIEEVIPSDADDPKWYDILTDDVMTLALLPGRVRTVEEWRTMFNAAGLELRTLVRGSDELSLLEAWPAERGG